MQISRKVATKTVTWLALMLVTAACGNPNSGFDYQNGYAASGSGEEYASPLSFTGHMFFNSDY